ncbi:hypothetical protein GCG21_13605 [Pseudactinotalea sp. HY160]|uniref:hypothetical protein n=1 Tax=Pseudactinotalea sp. HY160 TaxID=2654490 RepID=UPI00128AE2C9|nr:hypothetical protein [Pseudactinotalea sp. HY160]MPV51022.1 hypothetical protein [Pseudactinotalea sp. HY160]
MTGYDEFADTYDGADTGAGNDTGEDAFDTPTSEPSDAAYTSDAGDTADESNIDESGADEGSGQPAAGKRRRRTGPDKHLIRRSAAKSIELSRADETDVGLLATLLGTGTDPVDLAVAVMTSSRADTTVLSDVRDLAISDPAERAVTVLTMNKSRMKSIWQVLAELGVLPGTMPTADAKAALALSAADITDAVLGHVEEVASLAKKG